MKNIRSNTLSAGIDIGSTATKAIVFDGRIRGAAMELTGWDPGKAGLKALRAALDVAGVPMDRLGPIVGTGYGRISLPIFTDRVTEITCHARGAHHLNPGTRTVIDIGGQDCKVISLNEDGSVADFIMNDKCAAGTGRFLQVMAGILGVSLDEMSELAVGAEPVPLSSMCTVFTESEVIGLLARGTSKGNIAAGIIDTIARRIQGLAGRVSLREAVTFTGGMARNNHIREVITSHLGTSLHVPSDPQYVGALSAALIGCEG
jgi:predicted CoA-substrate-specific enzyme activase